MPRKITLTIPDKNLLPKAVGKLSLAAFMCILFRQNEKMYLEGQEPWTDEQLRELCRRQFPKSKRVSDFFLAGTSRTINQYRSLFNRGTIGDCIDYRYYPFISFRYDEFGSRVEGRYGMTVLTEAQAESMITEFQTLRRERGVYVPNEYLS